MKVLMTGNEAIARGAYEAGVKFASAYPGTPSTEILENIAKFEGDIVAEWATNEKVALETVIGASVAGSRAIASMKHVGLNVAADPLFSVSYTGIHAGVVIITADEPGQFSSQNEQDNRNYAKAAKIPMFEPANSQEAKDMVKKAFEISEEFDAPVLIRMTTRVCHSKTLVALDERDEVPFKEFKKMKEKFVTVPAFARKRRVVVDERETELQKKSNNMPENFEQNNDSKIGVITSGVCYSYAKEVFGDTVNYLKLGFTNPLPESKIKEFCEKQDEIYVIEENDPYIEECVQRLGFECFGYNTFPHYGEMLPDVIRNALEGHPEREFENEEVVTRPPTLCAGCPHRGLFYELGSIKNVFLSGDIGCYTLASAPPYNGLDSAVCMGASISMAHGAQKVFDMTNPAAEKAQRAIAIIGDSTFFHTGINSLINTFYNGSNTINIILDNRITGMTGHQDNPSTGYGLQGRKTKEINIEELVRAIGFENVVTINPNDLTEVKSALKEALAKEGEPSVIITRWPCILKRLSENDKEEFPTMFQDKYAVNHEKCIGCRKCIQTGCPAISFDKEKKKSSIDVTQCVGCSVCYQVCPVKAIGKKV